MDMLRKELSMTKCSLELMERYSKDVDQGDLEIIDLFNLQRKTDIKFYTCLAKSPCTKTYASEFNKLIEICAKDITRWFDHVKSAWLKINELEKENYALRLKKQELQKEIERLKAQPYN